MYEAMRVVGCDDNGSGDASGFVPSLSSSVPLFLPLFSHCPHPIFTLVLATFYPLLTLLHPTSILPAHVLVSACVQLSCWCALSCVSPHSVVLALAQCDSCMFVYVHSPLCSVAPVMTGVFANFPNKIAKITGKF